MALFIYVDGKFDEVTGEYEDAVVCEPCLVNDYDMNEGYGVDCLTYESELQDMTRAPQDSVCWLCGNEQDPA